MNKVTILKTARPCNKKWNGKKMTFGKPFTSAQATTCMVDTIKDVFDVIKSISEDTNLTWTPGGYFPAYEAHKEKFNIMAGTTMRKSLNKQDVSGIQSMDGIDYIARLKTNMLPSCVQLFDYDMSDAMPTKYQNMSADDLVGFMRSIFGEDVGFVVTESTSGRVEGLGKGKGYHLYAIIANPSDLERFKGAWLAQGFLKDNGWSFLKPTHCKQDNPARGLLAGDVCAYVPWSLFDPSVLASCERLDFIGKPYSPDDNPKVNPAKIKFYEGVPIDTSIIKSIEPEQRKQVTQILKSAGITLTGDKGFTTSVVGGINLDDKVETQDGWITIKDFISSSHEKLRCQVPLHIRDSESWNGILRMTEKGTAMLYDNGTRTSYFLPDVEVAKIAPKESDPKYDKPLFESTVTIARTRSRPDWLVKEVIPASSVGSFFGASGSYKSFIMIDLACCIASGRDWHGYRVKQGMVFIIQSEGGEGLGRRLEAWELENDHRLADDTPIFHATRSISLFTEKSSKEVAKQILEMKERHGEPAIIVVDTLAGAMAGGDESSAKDANVFIENLRSTLRDETKAAICVVHHTGHGNVDRGRGSSSFYAAWDFEFRVDRKDHTSVLTCTKQKDGEAIKPLGFDVVLTPLGYDDDDNCEVKSLAMRRNVTVTDFKIKDTDPHLAVGLLELIHKDKKGEFVRDGSDGSKALNIKALEKATGWKRRRISNIILNLKAPASSNIYGGQMLPSRNPTKLTAEALEFLEGNNVDPDSSDIQVTKHEGIEVDLSALI